MSMRTRFVAILCLPCFTATAWSAQPDAGSLLREELQRTIGVQPAMPPKPDTAAGDKAAAETGPKVTVAAFRIVGLTAVPDAEAQVFLASGIGQAMSLDALHRLAAKFEQWLRSRGLFLARAYVPPQDIKDGVVEIRVLEGRLEGIDIKRAPGTRLPEDKLRLTLAGALAPGSAMKQERLERGLLLLNDLPATSARAVLVPGKEMGTSRVVVEAAQGPRTAGSVELDNTGNRYSGDWRASAAISLNDGYGFGDQWGLRASASQGSTFVRAGYTVPIGADGWKAGVSWIDSRYRLCCDATVGALEANGQASALSGFVAYPLIRTRLANLSVSANWSSRSFVNRSLGSTISDKTSDALSLGISGDVSNMGGQGAYASYALQWVSGRMNLDGWAADKAQDETTAMTQGSFDKWSGQLTYLMRVSSKSALYAGFSGQWAGKNLDSSEKFVLGGPQGVRAYPTGEASGDSGWLLNLEWRREIDRNWRASLFVDHGEISLHRNSWANWNATTPDLGNRYALSGAGASLVFTPTPQAQIIATLASRLGRNPARDPSGRDSDNRTAAPRLWLQANLSF